MFVFDDIYVKEKNENTEEKTKKKKDYKLFRQRKQTKALMF